MELLIVLDEEILLSDIPPARKWMQELRENEQVVKDCVYRTIENSAPLFKVFEIFKATISISTSSTAVLYGVFRTQLGFMECYLPLRKNKNTFELRNDESYILTGYKFSNLTVNRKGDEE